MKTSPRFSAWRTPFVGFLTLLTLLSAAAAQITVTTLKDENDTPAGEKISLREALRDSANGGVIGLDGALAGGGIVLTENELTVTGKTVSITAPGLVIDARSRSRIFNVAAGAGLQLTGLTLQNGRSSSDDGGAILNAGTLSLTDCVLRDNHAPDGAVGTTGTSGGQLGGGGGAGGTGGSGGAVRVQGTGSMTALRCFFINNSAGNAGNGGPGGNADGFAITFRGGLGGKGGTGGSGGAVSSAGALTLTECIFSGNSAGQGGDGGYTGSPNSRVCGSDGGTAGSGGAVRQDGNLIVDRCTFHDNACLRGGKQVNAANEFMCRQYPGAAGAGAAVFCGSGVLTNSTFTGNRLAESGILMDGGTIAAQSSVKLVHCTVTGNLSSNPGFSSGFSPPETSGISGTSQCENCIITGNMVTVFGGGIQEMNFGRVGQPVLTPENSPGTTTGASLSLSPLSISSGFLPVLVPGAASPAIDAGAALTSPPATDQRGLPRAVEAPDAGAVEIQAAEAPPRAVQAITFTPPEVSAFSSLTLTASASSGLPVSFDLLSGPVTLTGNTLTFSGVGFAAVRASQSGDATRAPAFPVVRLIQSPPNDALVFGPAPSYFVFASSVTPVTFPATTTAGLPVTWTIASASGPGFSVSGNVLSASNPGNVVTRGRSTGDATHLGMDFSWPLTFVQGFVKWIPPGGQIGGLPWFHFVEGSSHKATITAIISGVHSTALPVPSLPPGLVPDPAVIPAGLTTVTSTVSLPADPSLVSQEQRFTIGDTIITCYLVNRTQVPLNITAPAAIPAGVSTAVEGVTSFIPPGLPPLSLSSRTVTVSAVDFDNPAVSVPVTLDSVTNGTSGIYTAKNLRVTFPPMERRVKLIVTTDDGITGQSGAILVSTNPDTDGDGVNDFVETALQRPVDVRQAPPLIIERDAAGLHAVLGNRPLVLQGWTIIIEQSTDLQTWSPAPAAATTSTPNPDGTTERVSVLLPAGSLWYARLKATHP